MTISSAPRLAACLKKVAATGWFSVGLAPMTMITSAFLDRGEGRGHRAGADGLHQRRHRGGVAQPGAVVDVVGAEAGAGPASGTGRPPRWSIWPSRSRPATVARAPRALPVGRRRPDPAPRPSSPRGSGSAACADPRSGPLACRACGSAVWSGGRDWRCSQSRTAP